MIDHSICIRQFITCPKCSHGYELALHSAKLAKQWQDHKTEIERLRRENTVFKEHNERWLAEIDRLRAEVLKAETRAEKAEAEVEKWQNIFSEVIEALEALAQKEPSNAQNTGTE